MIVKTQYCKKIIFISQSEIFSEFDISDFLSKFKHKTVYMFSEDNFPKYDDLVKIANKLICRTEEVGTKYDIGGIVYHFEKQEFAFYYRAYVKN